MAISVIIGILSVSRNPFTEKYIIIIYTFLSLCVTINLIVHGATATAIPVNLFTIFEFYVFAYLMGKGIGVKENVFTLTLPLFIFTVLAINYLLLLNEAKYALRTDLIITENVILTMFSLAYFKKFINGSYGHTDNERFLFWTVTGGLIYFCLTTPLFLFAPLLTKQVMSYASIINTLCNVTMHLTLIKAFVSTSSAFKERTFKFT